MQNIINGKAIAQKREQKLKEEVSKLSIKPKVVSILVGDDPPSILYTNMKQKKAQEIGIIFEPIRLPVETDFYKVSQLIISLNQDPGIQGVMIQLPLPKKFLKSHKTSELINLIKKEKDIDGLTENSPFLTAAVVAVMSILEEEQIDTNGKYAVVLGASELIGKKIAALLKEKGALVKLCDSHTENIEEFTNKADIIISATGVPHLLTGDMVKIGVVVIDVGVMIMEENSKEEKKPQTVPSPGTPGTSIVGDVDFDQVSKKAYKITPVPGGVGPITVVSLLENVLKAATK